jgi:metal-responsive CopG/Arc/MetJ family transcriptional regulator
MKKKISITLENDLVSALEKYAYPEQNRSEMIEEAVRLYIGKIEGEQRNVRERLLLDKIADRLNQEAAEVLEYQEFP